jgi:methylated-DNA-[protein]-cysteine S-methyltransferase
MRHGFQTRFGPVIATFDESGALTDFMFGETSERNPLAAEVEQQVCEYFDRQRTQFNLRLNPSGTPFQRAVWDQLLTIPFGQTRSYLEVAAALNNPKAVRAVGAANGANPIWLIIPCHRVIGKHGDLTGYGGGIDLKARLLEFEGIRTPGLFA